MSFGLLVRASADLDDAIGELAVASQLPRVDVMIDRDRPGGLDPRTRVIVDGWDAGVRGRWSPDRSNVSPLLLSVHIASSDGSGRRELVPSRTRDFLIERGPVGCSDTATLAFLESLGVGAYFSGSLTLTFPESTRERSDRVLLAGVPPVLRSRLPAELAARAVVCDTTTAPLAGGSSSLRTRVARLRRFVAARRLLHLCAGSGSVVTTRLNVALAATALGTPTTLLVEDPDDPRLGGLTGLVSHLPLEAAIDDPGLVDWSPTSSRGAHRAIAEDLRRTCKEFVEGRIPDPAKELAVAAR